MVVDASAIVAILRQENDAASFSAKLSASPSSSMSMVTYVETCMVIGGKPGEAGFRTVDQLLKDLSIVIVPVTKTDAELAKQAFLLYGKGRNPAQLNLGDLFSYALAKRLSEPLLFKGNDFPRTDIESA